MLSKRKSATRKGKIVLLNASKRFRKGRPKNYLPEEDIRPLAAMYLKGEPVEGEVAVITTEQAREADYNLSPSRWVGSGNDAELEKLGALLDRYESILKSERSLEQTLAQALQKLRSLT